MSCGRRQLFIYYRVDTAQSRGAIDAVHAMQRALCESCTGLQAGLLRRPDTEQSIVTLMETYAIDAAISPLGIDAALQAAIEARARSVLSDLITGTRHVEVFDACA
jgi:hypothetical protein